MFDIVASVWPGVKGVVLPVFCVTLNRPFPSCFEPHSQSEAKCKTFHVKISFHSNANKTNFHMKRFALILAFIMRFTATRKWPVDEMVKIIIQLCQEKPY